MEKDMIYLDNSATTMPLPASLEKMREALSVSYGNAGSVHAMGNEAQRLLSFARNAVGLTAGIRLPKDGSVIFTSGGSEANNLAIFGSLRAKDKKEGKVFITDGEHPSVNECANLLEKQGFEVLRVPATGGSLDLDFLEKNCDAKCVLCAFMLVNNETGALYDVQSAARIVREKAPKAFIHCDAVQGYLKTRFTLKSLGVDSIAVSAHKIHAPKGAGALFITEEVVRAKRLVPITLGGGQEMGFRSGTENVPAIAAFGVSAAEGARDMAQRAEKVKILRNILESNLPEEIRINRPVRQIDNILSITLPNIKSETMLNFLSGKGICISAGSACSARAGKPSAALTAFGLSKNEADCTVRISLSFLNTQEEMLELCSALKEGTDKLAKIK